MHIPPSVAWRSFHPEYMRRFNVQISGFEYLKERKVNMERIKIEMELAKALGNTERLQELAEEIKKVNVPQ